MTKSPGPPPPCAHELEAGLPADTLLAGLAALRPGRRAAPVQERLALLDTTDGLLHAAGALLTCAAGGTGVELALARPGLPELVQSLPAAPDFARELPPGPLRTALRDLAGLRRLLPQLDVERRRHGLELHDDQRKTVARLALVELRTRPAGAGGAWQELPARLLLQPLRGFAAEAAAVRAVLASRPGLRLLPPDAPDPLREALGRALPAPPPAPGSDLRAGMRADESLRRVLRAHLAVMRWNEPGLRADLDSEFLHDWRVAARRTRCLLGQVRKVLPADEARRFRDELGWLARLSGPVRDLDVFLLLIEDAGEGPAAIAGLQPLAEALRERLVAERRQMLEGLDSPRARELLAEWEAFLARAPERRPAAAHARERFGELAARRVRKLHRRLVSEGAALGPGSSAAELHALRITAKKMRYVLDAARRVLDPAPAASVLAALRHLQQALGDAHDAHVQASLLAESAAALGAAGRATPEVLLAIGRLSERLATREAAARAQFVERHAVLASAPVRAALRALLRPGGKARP